MNINRVVAFCITAVICLSAPFGTIVSATETNSQSMIMTQLNNEDQQRDAGLIKSHLLSVASNPNEVLITSYTICNDIMAEIGETNIEVQRSSNGTSGWITYTTVPQQINYDSASHYLNSYVVNVTSGYYYRVKVTHYAKEQGWFFPDSQSINVTSSVLWIG